MSDFSAGGFPPAAPPPPTGPSGAQHRKRNPAAWIAVIAAAVLVVAGGVAGVLLLNREEPAAVAVPAAVVVTLEPTADTGADPFLAAATVIEPAAFPDSVRVAADATAAVMTSDPASGALTVSGTTASLYGGSGDNSVCDVEQLATFLEANPAKAGAWASARGIDSSQIRPYLAGLTPVALLFDTAVTNYGFADGVATPRQAVLQAGTAVLVDDTGAPVVRCTCGNPLSAPQVANLPSAQFLGTRWESFDPARSVFVTAGSKVTGFTLVDLQTGATFEQPVGVAVPSVTPTGLLVGIAGPFDPAVGVTDSSIVTSADGVSWSTAFTPSATVRTLATGGGTIVALGETTAISQDGITWIEVAGGPTGIVDVAYGNGSWLAVAGPPDPAAGIGDDVFSFVTFASADGRSWQQTQIQVPVAEGGQLYVGSVAYGNGQWTVGGVTELGDSAVQENVVSTDGQTWTDPGGSDLGPVGQVAWNGELWGQVGGQINYFTEPPTAKLFASVSSDLSSFTTLDANPTGSLIFQLSCSGDRGWLAAGSDLPLTTTDRPADLFASADLVNWTKVGRPEVGGLADVLSYGDANEPSAQVCGVAGSSTPAPGAETPGSPDLAGRCVLDVSGEAGWLLVAEGLPELAAGFPCESMQQIWTKFLRGESTADLTPVPCTSDWYGSGAPPDGFGGVCPISAKIAFNGWRIGSAGADAALAGTPADAGTLAPAAPAGAVPGDLGLTRPMTRPACDGTGIVLLLSATNPATYQQDVQQALNDYPDAQYLRTDQSCSSLVQSLNGNPIYAVYRPIGTDATAVCAAVTAVGGTANGRWLENSSPDEARINCG